MKIFSKISCIAMLLTASLGMYAAEKQPTPPQHEQWQREAEAFLHGLGERTGQKSLVKMELGIYPAEQIAKMLKPDGYIRNHTDKIVEQFSVATRRIELSGQPFGASISIIPPDTFIVPPVNSILPNHSIRCDFIRIKAAFQEVGRGSIKDYTIRFKLSGQNNMHVDNVRLDENSNIEIKDTTDGVRLIVTPRNEFSEQVIYVPIFD